MYSKIQIRCVQAKAIFPYNYNHNHFTFISQKLLFIVSRTKHNIHWFQTNARRIIHHIEGQGCSRDF